MLIQSKAARTKLPTVTGSTLRASATDLLIMNFVTMCGCPQPPSANMKYQDKQPSIPNVPHGPMASGSSRMMICTAPAAPPSTA